MTSKSLITHRLLNNRKGTYILNEKNSDSHPVFCYVQN